MYRMARAAATTDTGLAMSASYTYADDLLTKIQTSSTIYNFTYGNFALRTKVAVGERTLATYSYEDVTNYLTELEYGNGDKLQYTYDDKGRLLTQTYEDGATVTYTYDNNGALATVTDANDIKTTYYYDFTDRMMKYVESGTNYSHSVGYEYDNINNLTSQVETINGVDRSSSYTYDQDNRVTSKQTGNTKVTYTYDGFSRISTQTTYNGEDVVLTETFTYNPGSAQIATYTTTIGEDSTIYEYSYDKNGNILSVRTSHGDIAHTTSYEYDTANQLIRENNQEKGYTHTWTYSNAGNILERKEYAYTTGDLETATVTAAVSYVYETGDNKWGDLLTHYGSQEFYYDEIGNITDDGTWTYDWQHGRQLASMAKKDSSATWNFAYNADGLRTERANTDRTTVYNYVYNGSQLTAMTVGENTLYFSYNAAGTPMSVKYGSEEYFYTTNIQGDVTGIVNDQGQTVVTYAYDAWGNILSTTDTTTNNLGTLNPLRYRGYVFDQDSGLYYLQSRYYNPVIGRFINADGLTSTSQGLVGNTMFVYCLNNPTNFSDTTGFLAYPAEIHNQVIKHINAGYQYHTEQIILYDKGYGRADIISVDGYVWDVKPNKPHHIKAGEQQVQRYTQNKWKKFPDLRLKVGDSRITSGNFYYTGGDTTYYVTYYNAGNGVIAYDYSPIMNKPNYNYNYDVTPSLGQVILGVVVVIGLILIPGPQPI